MSKKFCDVKRIDKNQLPASISWPASFCYDASSMHHKRSTLQGSQKIESTIHVAPTPNVDEALYEEMPALRDFVLEDEEDAEDVKTIRREHKKLNNYLIFCGAFALIVTLCITNFTILPSRRPITESQILVLVTEINDHIRALHQAAATNSNYTGIIPPSMLPNVFDVKYPLLIEVRDTWVPTLWYFSLMSTVLATMLGLLVKHWLLTCSFSLLPPPYESNSVDETGYPVPRNFPAYLRARQTRRAQTRQGRKEALEKTRMVKSALVMLKYSALLFYFLGMLLRVLIVPYVGR